MDNKGGNYMFTSNELINLLIAKDNLDTQEILSLDDLKEIKPKDREGSIDSLLWGNQSYFH